MNFTLDNFLNGTKVNTKGASINGSKKMEKAVEATKKTAGFVGRTMKHVTPASIAYVEKVAEESLDRDLELHIRLSAIENLLNVADIPEEELVQQIAAIKQAMKDEEVSAKKEKKEEKQAVREAKRAAREEVKKVKKEQEKEDTVDDILHTILSADEEVAVEVAEAPVKAPKFKLKEEAVVIDVPQEEAVEDGDDVFDDVSESRYDYSKMSQ